MGSEAITVNDLREILGGLSTITLPRVQSGLTGEIRMYAGSEEPIGWMKCDGRAISRTTYAELFAAIGTTYGVGDESTTFNIPDFRGRFPIGVGTGTASDATNRVLGQLGGSERITLNVDQLPAHKHRISYRTGVVATGTSGMYYFDPGTAGTWHNSPSIDNTGGGESHGNMPPYITINFIICYRGADSTSGGTYTLSKNGNIITLTGSIGDTSSVIDGNTTYAMTASGNTILLTDSDGNTQTATVSGGGGGGSFSAIVVVLTPSDWSNNSQTTTATGVTSSSTVIISPALESFDEYMECNIKCTTQGTDSLTFTCDFVPSTTLMVNVLIG